MLMPAVERYMSRQPWTIRPRDTLAVARERMREHDLRHLPVVDGHELVGIVSARDLYMLQAIAGVNACETRVHEAMTEQVYAVPPDAPIAEVASVMSERKLGSVVVMRDGVAEGIFTTVDACRALAEILDRIDA
jgi:acetoin utilization protein AcuB